MKSVKKSVRLAKEALEVGKALGDEVATINWSAGINSMAVQYQLFAKYSKPEMPQNHWEAIFECFKENERNTEDLIMLLPIRVHNRYEKDDVFRKWFTDESEALALIEQLNGMSECQRIAIIFEARKHWYERNKPLKLLDENAERLIG
ncbi:hypothetical protein [Shewanella algae]|uniref:hypothetical protein n=1 Tax=Shewanella algae TaxID=38313 RepID=UPI0038B4124A